LRLFPLPLIKYGIRQNHHVQRAVMTYIHPREINPDQPRLPLPLKKRFKYYIGLNSTQRKLQYLLRHYGFGTVSQVMANVQGLKNYQLRRCDQNYDINAL